MLQDGLKLVFLFHDFADFAYNGFFIFLHHPKTIHFGKMRIKDFPTTKFVFYDALKGSLYQIPYGTYDFSVFFPFSPIAIALAIKYFIVKVSQFSR